MNLRGQILLGSVLVATIPLVLAIQIIRQGVEDRFTDLDTARVENLVRLVQDDLERQDSQLVQRLQHPCAPRTKSHAQCGGEPRTENPRGRGGVGARGRGGTGARRRWRRGT